MRLTVAALRRTLDRNERKRALLYHAHQIGGTSAQRRLPTDSGAVELFGDGHVSNEVLPLLREAEVARRRDLGGGAGNDWWRERVKEREIDISSRRTGDRRRLSGVQSRRGDRPSSQLANQATNVPCG